jgi:glycosyltransferase involved in cell wall biosynthesis
MRVGLDATPLLGLRTGVGRYVAGLVEGFEQLGAGGAPVPPEGSGEPRRGAPVPEELVLVPFTWRGTRDLPASAGATARGAAGAPRVRCGRRRVPARLLAAAWARLAWPPVEWLAGRVDVFHATNFVSPPTRRAAPVLTVHDLTYLHYPRLVTAASARYRELVPRGLARGAVVCTPTAAVGAEVADAYRIPAERVVVTPLGVRPSWLAARPPDPGWLAGRGLPGRYLLFVGSREPRKGLDVLLAAYRELLADQPDAPPLVLAGPPGWGPALDLAGLPGGAVRLPGYLREDELASLTAGAAALVCPSRYEGFGLPPLEALACGTPVVASDLPALREVLGTEAELVPVGDAGALAGTLAAVLKDPGDEAARAARQARAAAFTWPACAAATLAAYRQALEATP